VKARIHRGATEIGGSCVELEAEGKRIVLDLGRPLWAEADQDVELPQIDGLLGERDSGLLGVVISHGHPDHYGLLDRISPTVPVYIGKAASQVLKVAAFYTPIDWALQPAGFLIDGEALQLGPFRVTPWLVDHSAFDSHALQVEAEGRCLFYSGDLRAHGRKPGTFQRLLNRPPEEVDVLLMEGTRLSRDDSNEGQPSSEVEVENRCAELFHATDGMALACYSAQNIDRFVSVYKAALHSDRDLVIDLYTAEVAAATGYSSIPSAGWERVKVFVPQAQRLKIRKSKAFGRIDAIRDALLFPEQLAAERGRLVMTFRATMASDLERACCLSEASAVWSMWPGYLQQSSSDRLKSFLERNQIPLSLIHASGHATVDDLKSLARALGGARIVPIHTTVPKRFATEFGRAEIHRDGEWWEV
jgi:ribonuclease J